jgi:NADPH-dependent curcumin reductase CurA
MRAGTCGTVVKSNHPDYKEGDFVVGSLGVQQYAVSDGKFCYKSDTFGLPKEKFLGVLGMPGFTAYFGLLDITNPQEGETLVVSGAEKCATVVNDYGFDACIDYKNDNVPQALKEHCPKGIDIYFDNVGGDILDHCLAKLRFKGRVSLCGAISQYNSETGPVGPKNYLSILVNSAKMEGFIVMNYQDRYMEAAKQLGEWMMSGQLKSKETVIEGIDTFPDTFNRLFTGNKLGKLVIKA